LQYVKLQQLFGGRDCQLLVHFSAESRHPMAGLTRDCYTNAADLDHFANLFQKNGRSK